jgi:hypothetical protein
MIPKGNARGGGQQLATHLMNAYDNDSVEVVELRGAIARDLHGAFAEWHAQSKGTQCRKYLYSLSVNPDHRQGPFTREKYYDFIARTEKRLKLDGQPRAVVFHVKEGRQHCHVVWSRIDTQKMKAVQLSHDRQKLRFVAQEYAKVHGLTLPSGMRNNRGLERFNHHAKGANLAENQQKERTGVPKEERLRLITEAWNESKDAQSFVDGLAARGYYLARGDSRGHVVVDLGGEIHSLYREVENVKGKEIRQRLAAGYAPETLRDVRTVLEYAKAQREERLKEQAAAPERKTITPEECRADLKKDHAERRGPLEKERKDMQLRHRAELDALTALQRGENKSAVADRARGKAGRVVSFLKHITGIQLIVEAQQRKADKARGSSHASQTLALLRRHTAERQEIDRKSHVLDGLEKRERRSMETEIRREQFRSIAAPLKKPAAQVTPAQKAAFARAGKLAGAFRQSAAPLQPSELTKEQREKLAAFKRDRQKTVTPAFNRAADPKDAGTEAQTKAPERTAAQTGRPASLAAQFKEAAAGAEPAKVAGEKEIEQGQGGGSGGGLSEAFRRAQELKQKEVEEEQTRKTRSPKKGREQ